MERKLDFDALDKQIEKTLEEYDEYERQRLGEVALGCVQIVDVTTTTGV